MHLGLCQRTVSPTDNRYLATVRAHKMHAWFWFSTSLRNFLFAGYDVAGAWSLLATCSGLLSLAVIYEAMKVFQMRLHKRTVSSLGANTLGSSENSSLLTQLAPDGRTAAGANWLKWTRWMAEVSHWSAQTTLGYLLMLAVMTYNAYVAIAIVTGATLGYWFFGMTVIEMNLEEYRAARNKIAKCDPECADSLDNETRRESEVSNAEPEVQLVAGQVNAEVHRPVAS